jgi:hypothetical protein
VRVGLRLVARFDQALSNEPLEKCDVRLRFHLAVLRRAVSKRLKRCIQFGLTPNIRVLQSVSDAVPDATLYWFASHTVPVVPVAAGSGLAPE